LQKYNKNRLKKAHKTVDFWAKSPYNTYINSKKSAKQPVLFLNNIIKKRLQIAQKAHIIDIVVS
jgi:hypothetical protein